GGRMLDVAVAAKNAAGVKKLDRSADDVGRSAGFALALFRRAGTGRLAAGRYEDPDMVSAIRFLHEDWSAAEPDVVRMRAEREDPHSYLLRFGDRYAYQRVALLDGVYHVLSAENLAEDGVLAVQVGSGDVGRSEGRRGG